jgi:hypothetical protein
MKEREKILSGRETTNRLVRKLYVSLLRADAVIDGAPPSLAKGGNLLPAFELPASQ